MSLKKRQNNNKDWLLSRIDSEELFVREINLERQ